MDVPCLNHMLNNSFVNTMKSCMEFKNIIESIESRALILRKRDAIDNIGKNAHCHPRQDGFIFITRYHL